jgi:hypothetical protein
VLKAVAVIIDGDGNRQRGDEQASPMLRRALNEGSPQSTLIEVSLKSFASEVTFVRLS